MKRLLLLILAAIVSSGASCHARHGRIGHAELYWLLNRACVDGDDISVRMLLEAGADPNGVRDYAAFHRSKYQFGVEPSWPINQAAVGGHTDVVRLLLRAGAKVDAPEDEGQTALTLAATKGHLDVVRLLLEAGADKSYRGPGAGGFVGTAEEIARNAGHGQVADAIRDFRLK
ncbi:MAG: ankyrin repeat domain-containing protein [Vicinamibacterales bacterium]